MLYILCLIHAVLAGTCSTLYTEDECNVIYSYRQRGINPILTQQGRTIWFNNTSLGTFPTEVIALSAVATLVVLDVPITGTIPTQICSMPNLTSLNLFQVSLSGSLPSCLFNTGRMLSISVYDTIIGGTIPSLVNSNLTYLSVKNSAISGSIPIIGPSLQRLILSGNNIEGTITSNLYSAIAVEIGENKLSGTIPHSVASDKISRLDLSNNNFHGTVPYISTIQFFDVSYNLFDNVSRVAGEYWSGTALLDLTGNRISTQYSYNPIVRIDVTDVDECLLQRYICPLGARCTDGWYPKMSYTCECSSGYELSSDNKECVDINECLSTLNACSIGMCLNVPGSYTCCSNGTYSTGTHCDQCYSSDYVYDIVRSNPLPPTHTTMSCFGSCKTGVAFRHRKTLSPVCPEHERIHEMCSYPCSNSTFGMSAFDAINTLHNELKRGDYVDQLLGSTNSTTLEVRALSISLMIHCIECDSVIEAVRIIAPDIVLERTQYGVGVMANGSSKSTTYIVVSVIVGTCSLLLILIMVFMLSRDRTQRLHEELAKTIRVPLYTRLTRQLLTDTNTRPPYIEQIMSVKRIYNTVLLDNFVGTYLVQKERLLNKAFHKRSWTIDADRTQVHNAYVALANSFSWNSPDYPTVLCVMHGTSVPLAEMIAKTGFAALSTLDSGWYGTGIYFTTSFKYCLPYIASRPRPAIIISYVLPGNVYPVTSREEREGKPLMSGYQSHYVRTTSDGKPSICGEYDEVVVGQESQILPMYIVEIEPLKAVRVSLDR